MCHSPLGEPFMLRIEERTVVHLAFLEPPPPSPPSPAGGGGGGSGGSHQSRRRSAYVPQLALLHQDAYGYQHVATHGIDLGKKRLIANGRAAAGGGNNPRNSASGGRGGAKKPAAVPLMPPPGEQLRRGRIDGGSGRLIPVPPPPPQSGGGVVGNFDAAAAPGGALGGVIVLGQRHVAHYPPADDGVARVRSTGGMLLLSACRIVDDDDEETKADGKGEYVARFLLGDDRGRLHLLSLVHDANSGGAVSALHFETLGTVSSSSSLSYLGTGHVFVGSQFGDSQLVRILDDPVPTGTISGGLRPYPSGDDDAGPGTKDDGPGPLADTTYLEVIEEYTNLGPIVDFDLRPCDDDEDNDDASPKAETGTGDMGHLRQSVVATCSGFGKDCSVRLVRNGVGMREHASVDMAGIKGMWSLRGRFDDDDDAYLVQSFVGETRILGVMKQGGVDEDGMDDGEEEGGAGALAEVTIPGFDPSRPTLFACNVSADGGDDGASSSDLLLQVVEDGVRLVDAATLALVARWSPFDDDGDDDDEDEPAGFITVASANESGQIVVALRGGALVYLLVEGGGNGAPPSLRRAGRASLDREVSCADLNPLRSSSSTSLAVDDSMDVDDDGVAAVGRGRSRLVAVGLWDDFSVRLLDLGGSGGGGNPSSSAILGQVLRIDLGRGSSGVISSASRVANDVGLGERDNDEDDEGGRHMMARSLCLVTMDSLQSANGVAKRSSFSSAGVDMLLVGLGDGKLISFVVDGNDADADGWSVRSRKEVGLGARGVRLVPFRHGDGPGSACVLATGERPTVVYLAGGGDAAGGNRSNPRLNYSTVSLTVDEDDEEEDDDEDEKEERHRRAPAHGQYQQHPQFGALRESREPEQHD